MENMRPGITTRYAIGSGEDIILKQGLLYTNASRILKPASPKDCLERVLEILETVSSTLLMSYDVIAVS